MKNKETTEKSWFIAPAVIFLILMVVIPVVFTFYLSFTKWNMVGVPKFQWLKNYIEMFKESRFLNSLWRTIVFSGLALALEIFLGTAIAFFLNREFLGKSFIKTLFLLPMVATPVSLGLVWMLIYEPTFGIANSVLGAMGLTNLPLWLGSPKTSLLSLAIVDIWQWTPMISLIVMAGLAGIPNEPFESAHVAGATSFQIMTKITIPMITPTIVVAGMLRLIDVLKTFDIIYSTTQGGPAFSSETLNILAYINAFQYFDFGYASAMLVVFFLIVLFLSIAVGKIRDRVRIDF